MKRCVIVCYISAFFLLALGCNLRFEVWDYERQKGITRDYARDNFTFDKFAGVDWSDSTTFKEDCDPLCVVPTMDSPPDDILIPALGISKDNYVVVKIRDDNSNWVRAGIQVVLYPIFHEADKFAYFVNKINEAAKKFADVPGFSGRFRQQDLIKLLETLNQKTPQERLALFNKAKVDAFLDFSFRALLHANFYHFVKDANLFGHEDHRKRLKAYLTTDVAGLNSTFNVFMVFTRSFFPDEPRPYFSTTHGLSLTSELSFTRQYSMGGDILGSPTLDQDKARVMETFLSTNTKSADELKRELENADRAFQIVKKDLLNTASPDKKRHAEDLFNELNKARNNYFAVSLAADFGINSFRDLHTHKSMDVLYVEKKHTDLMINKSALNKFGY